MTDNYEIIKNFKSNVELVEDLKGYKLVRKKFLKNENKYTAIYKYELEVLNKLQHSNIVKIEKVEEDDEYYYILFKYIDGDTFVNKFNNLINDRIRCNFFKSIIKILETLDYIHSHNFFHQDIKSNNIIVDEDYNPYILDFGTATISNTMTRTQQELTLWYASPEQKNNQTIDITTDLYSFGITILETIISVDIFKQFTTHQLSIDDTIELIDIFEDGINEELKNIIKKLTYQSKADRYQRAKDVIVDIKRLLGYFNCTDKYRLELSDTTKNKIKDDYDLSVWEINNFVEEKLSKELIYVQFEIYNDKEQIKIVIDEFLLNCAIRNEHFYVVGYTQVLSSIDYVKKNGFIIDDIFLLSNEYRFSSTHSLVEKLEQLRKDSNKKDTAYKIKKSFLDITENRLKIEREILEKRNISLFAENIKHNKSNKELIVKIRNLQNTEITKVHLKEYSKNEQFSKELFEDGFTNNPSDINIVKLLNNLINNNFFEKHKKDISKKFYKINNNKSLEEIESELIKRYKSKVSDMAKLKFNSELLFFIYKAYITQQQEKPEYFKIKDNVIVESILKNNEFNQVFIVKKLNVEKQEIILTTNTEFSEIPKELKISFDYKRDDILLNKRKRTIQNLKNNNTTIENLLSKISNPKTLAPKKEIPKCTVYYNHEIDENQQESVDKAISLENGEYLLIQGPPGTGKTTVITEIVNQILQKNKKAKILVTSQSNQAVDNVLEKICDKEERIVRFGDINKLSNIAKKYHDDLVFDKYLQNLSKKLKDDNTNYFLENNCLDKLHKKWKSQVLSGDITLKSLLFKNIRVIFGTLMGIASWKDFRNIEFDYVIVDESGRAQLDELMIPLEKAKKFILVGDHKQLPPIIDKEILENMKEHNKQDLETTLFEELYNKIDYNDFKHFLKFNYRSHKSISKIYSDIFYDGKIETKNILDGKREHQLNFDKKVYFYSTSKLENRFDKEMYPGKKNDTNRDEIIKVLYEIEKQAKENNIKKSVGIITPYLAQRDNIKSKFGQIQSNFTMLTIEINSVDAFQGSDRDIIIYDIVRSEEKTKSNIKFVADEKRLNVALSRTKELLFIIGDADFISSVSIEGKKNPFEEILILLSKDNQNYKIREL